MKVYIICILKIYQKYKPNTRTNLFDCYGDFLGALSQSPPRSSLASGLLLESPPYDLPLLSGARAGVQAQAGLLSPPENLFCGRKLLS